jgi:ribonucleoside-triphosphate reductase (thioredoxin)
MAKSEKLAAELHGLEIEVSKSADKSHRKSKAAKYHDFIPKIEKRDGAIVPFDFNKIVAVVQRAMTASEEGSLEEAEIVAHRVVGDIISIAKKYKNFLPTVEGLQDEVEKQLILADYVATAKAYILYRDRRNQLRKQGVAVPESVRALVDESKKYFHSSLQEFVFYTAYARWSDEEGRRETWVETVDRFMDFMRENLGKKLSEGEYEEVRENILTLEVCPSMRLLWSAGPAARRCNAAAYNCTFIAPTRLRDFGEIMYISMSGCGLGFSAESDFVEQLPQIKRQTKAKPIKHVIDDSKEGWADSVVFGLETWFDGHDVEFDFSQVRPAGERLNTMGGRSSGPEPLREILAFLREKVLARQGKRLRTIDVHDIVCKIGEGVVAGGVRRSALISLSDLEDELIRDSKKGQFYLTEPQRSLSNNSAVYRERPTAEFFLDEWTSLVKSQTGERGIFSAVGLETQLPKRRVAYLKKKYGEDLAQAPIRTNPCGEIYLQSRQMCNLSSIVVRPRDTIAKLERKIEIATLLGTYQSTLTNFNYLSKDWKKNCEDERLLGVSLTGYYDNAHVRDKDVLERLRDISTRVNKKYAKRFHVNESTCITCVKPHGNSSQLLDTASGMHPRYAKYYIRRVRISRSDPIFQMLRDQGLPSFPEVGQTEENATTFVLEFPVVSPKGSIVMNDVSAMELLEQWKILKTHFTDHNPSVTVSVGHDEWIAVANFLYENWEKVGGLSFLPRNDHVYSLAPYQEIDKKEYERRVSEIGEIDFAKLVTYEQDDQTRGAKELACVGGACEI